MEFTVIDSGGQWVTNPHQYSFVDPETKVRFDPAKLVRVGVKAGSWLAKQMDAKVIVPADGPAVVEVKAEGKVLKAHKSAGG